MSGKQRMSKPNIQYRFAIKSKDAAFLAHQNAALKKRILHLETANLCLKRRADDSNDIVESVERTPTRSKKPRLETSAKGKQKKPKQ
jgi:hypothetical protein